MLNAFNFWLRSTLKWQWPGYQEPFEPKNTLWEGRFDTEALTHREQELLSRYPLQHWQTQGTQLRYQETLTYLDYLESLLPQPHWEEPVRWLDVGVKNWAYVEALYFFMKHYTALEALHGIELDGYRIYTDFHSRADYAQAYLSDLENTTFEVGNVMVHQQSYDVVSCFLPFVFKEPCLQWGLPIKVFQPQAFLKHLLSLVQPKGYLLLVNQGEAEFEAQEALLKELAQSVPELNVTAIGKLSDSFMNYQYPRYGWQCQLQAK